MARRTYFIGRGKANDIRLTDPTVSRRHAELVVTEDERCFLTDCASTQGTQVLRGGRWTAVRQAFVSRDDSLRFGEHRARVHELLAQVSPRTDEGLEVGGGRARDGGGPSGPVVRNPLTGEVQKLDP